VEDGTIWCLGEERERGYVGRQGQASRRESRKWDKSGFERGSKLQDNKRGVVRVVFQVVGKRHLQLFQNRVELKAEGQCC
jgi:hypothetical protein